MDGATWFIIFFTTAILMAVGAFSYYFLTKDKRLRRRTEGWTEARATITDAVVRSTRGGRGPSLNELTIAYRYTASGKVLAGRKTFFVTDSEARATPALRETILPMRYDPVDAVNSALFVADVRDLCRRMLVANR